MANNPSSITATVFQNELPHRIQARIDRAALAHNLQVARRYAKGGRIVAVVKANAYGHGTVQAAEALSAADLYAVTDVEEAERLRLAGPGKGILILQGIMSAADLPLIFEHGYQVLIHRWEDLALLEQAVAKHQPKQPLTLWLKLDSGMGRLGLRAAEYLKLGQTLLSKPWVENLVLTTHLASASDPGAALNAVQLDTFAQVRAHFPDCASSIASSAGLLALDCAADWNRPGIMLYGSSPFAWRDEARRREAFDLKPVMTLEARLIGIKDHQSGDNIGYNSQFICDRPMRVGTVSCGYADGYPSTTPNGSPVALDGRRSRTLGRVSMDMLAVDLTDFPDATLGMPVELWGKTISLDEVAAHTGVLSYNLTCSITSRVPKRYE
jgi:alanine racemase